MDYINWEKLKKKINEEIEDLKEFETVDYYVDANFQQFSNRGEYDDNSIDLSYHYNMMKRIENDPDFMNKLYFVLLKFIKGVEAKK